MHELKERGKERDKDALVFSIKSPRIWFLSALSKAKLSITAGTTTGTPFVRGSQCAARI